MCNECKNPNEDIKSFAGDSGIWYKKDDDQYYLVMEQYRGERNQVIINNCPWCGENLKESKIQCKYCEMHDWEEKGFSSPCFMCIDFDCFKRKG